MTSTVKVKKIRPSENYVSMKDADLLTASRTVETSMTGNVNFPNPLIDPQKVLKVDNDSFDALIAQAQDGGRKVVAQKNKQREVVIKDLRLNGRYDESISNNDLAIFTSSGFVPTSGVRAPQVPLSPTIRSLNHGTVAGQLIVRMKAVAGALSYELRYAPETNGVPGTWVSQLVTAVKSPIPINGLTPGTVYAFSARAMDKAGYSDWSDPVTMMCT